MGQGQPRVIIWIIFVVLPYTMLHTKFQGHWSIGSGEEDFLRFLPYMGMAAMLVIWPRPFEQIFFPKGPGGCIWNLVAIGPVVSEEKSFEIVDVRRTDDEACLYYKLPGSLRLRWAKNLKGWSLNFGDVYFGDPYLALQFQGGASFSDPHAFFKQVAIWSWLLLLKIETYTLNMKSYWKQWLHIIIKKKLDNIEIMKTQSK